MQCIRCHDMGVCINYVYTGIAHLSFLQYPPTYKRTDSKNPSYIIKRPLVQ